MSRIGRLPIQIPDKVSVVVSGSTVTAKGPNGQLTLAVPELVEYQVGEKQITVTRANESKRARERHGLARTLLFNAVTGVSTGFERVLEIVGVGYKAEVKDGQLVLQLGYSHPVEFPIPKGLSISVGKKNDIVIRGIDKELVGQTAAVIRGFRKPDAYKGKGLRYRNEVGRLKAGKAGATK